MTDVLLVVGAVVVVLLLGSLLVRHYLGVPLLCHLGFHRWRKTLVGRGRDAQYVVKCAGCEAMKEDE